MMTWIYNTGFLVFGLFYLPVFILKCRQAEDAALLLRERLGRPDEAKLLRFAGKRVVWLHAVSVGEVMAAERFVRSFSKMFPDFHLVLTTVTPTGQRIAAKLQSEDITVFYCPFDFSPAVRGFLERVRPFCLLLMETEIWPNLLRETERSGIPSGILNARLSEKSHRGYKRFSALFRESLQSLDFVLTQTPEDAGRFRDLGLDSEKVEVLGNMKFDNVSLEAELPERGMWEIHEDDLVLVAGSTHPGEEEILADAFLELRERFERLRLIIAPRHIERSGKIARRLRGKGLFVRCYSEGATMAAADILILDQLGLLKKVYGLADVVFIGGTLASRGGQNPIEPAALKKPVVHGPHVSNFKYVFDVLDSEGGAVLARNKAELNPVLLRLLKSRQDRKTTGDNAFAAVSRLRGATARHLQRLAGVLLQESSMVKG